MVCVYSCTRPQVPEDSIRGHSHENRKPNILDFLWHKGSTTAKTISTILCYLQLRKKWFAVFLILFKPISRKTEISNKPRTLPSKLLPLK